MATEQRLEEDYRKALGEGRVKVAYGRVMILGPGGVGKSSLLSGLTNKQLPEEANSTQVAEINTFQPGKGSYREASSLVARSGEIAEGYWTPVTEDDEMKELVGLVHLVYNVSSKHITSSRVFQGLSTVAANLLGRSSASSVNVSAARKIIAEVIELAKQYPDIQAPESEVFLYVWDCGGQQVFLSILPAFLTSKSMFFLMFDARYPLHDRLISLSHYHGNVTEHIEEVTTAELLLQWMSCIHATLSEDEPSTTIPQYPCILPVGTHGDDPRVKKDKDGILEQLFDEYKDKSCAHLIPEKGFIIDNTTAGKGSLEDPTYKMILKRVHNFASNKIANVDTPVSWVLFRKVMKIMSKGQPYFSMEEVKEIAEACMIPKNLVPSVLKFYHDLAVFFHYTNIPSLKDLVIANPQWLVRQIAKLLALKNFEETATAPHLWEIFRRNGILVEALYTEVLKAPKGDEKSVSLPPQVIVDLLEHFLILAPVDTRSKVHTLKGKEYFVPSVLPPLLSLEDHTPATPRESTKKAASLHVIFPSVNYLPPGYFTRLATTLSKEPGFSLAFGQGIYRNKVSFVMGEPGSQIDTLTISEHKYSVQIEVRREAPRKTGNPLFSEVCLNLITIIEKSSIDICQWLPRIETAFGFNCDKCENSSKHFVLLNSEFTTESQVRCQRDIMYTLHGNQKFWLKVENIQSTVPLSDAEIAAIAREVKEFDQLKDVLEMTEHEEKDPVVLIKRWIKEMRKINIPPRPYLIHYLMSIDLRGIAKKIKYEEISTAPTSNSKNLESKDQDEGQKPDHSYIYKKLKPYAYKWEEIARGLRFTPAELNNIKANPSHSTAAPESYLSAMLSDWLECIPRDTRGSTNYATMEDLRSAVDSAGLGLTASEL